MRSLLIIIVLVNIQYFISAQRNPGGQKSITSADSLYVVNIIKGLQGIEKYAVKNDFYLLNSLLKYKGDSITAGRIEKILLKKDDYLRTYIIEKLDIKSGYIKFSPAAAEVTYTMTYWNMKDGSKLIATESWGCGPVCQSEVRFQTFENGKYLDKDETKVIPDIEKLPGMLVPDYSEKNSDPLEFKFLLPQNGKNINFCLEKKCIELKWNEGTFVIN